MNNYINEILLTIIFVVVSVCAFKTYAFEVPSDAVIKVYTKDGKEIGSMSRKDYKVVKIEDDVQTKLTTITIYMKPEPKNNRITVKAGTGYYDMNSSYTNNINSITQRRDAVLGLSYSRMLTEEFSLGATVLTNETLTLDAGVDF